MSHTRLVRTSLLMAALCLNIAPAFAADPKPAAPAAAPVGDVLRPEIAKTLNQAEIRDLMAKKSYNDVAERIKTAEAMPTLSPFEQYYIERIRLMMVLGKNDEAGTIKSFEAVIASGRLEKKDQAEFIAELANTYARAKNHAKAIEWYKRHMAENGPTDRIRYLLALAYYQTNDFTSAKNELAPKIEADAKAGKVSPENELRMLVVCSGKLKDWATYVPTLEKLVISYPNDELWTDLLKRLLSKPTFNENLTLDLFRLNFAATKAMEQEYYVEMAERALTALFPAEAKKALDAGFANGVLGTGSDAAKHKSLRDKATKMTADDVKNIAASDAAAMKSKDGIGMINLGYTYVTMEQFDKGIDLIEKGIAKGMPAKVEPVKGKAAPAPKMRIEDAKLRLATAYAMAGRKEAALKAFAEIKGDDGLGDLARYWTMWLNRAEPAAAAPAAAK